MCSALDEEETHVCIDRDHRVINAGVVEAVHGCIGAHWGQVSLQAAPATQFITEASNFSQTRAMRAKWFVLVALVWENFSLKQKVVA